MTEIINTLPFTFYGVNFETYLCDDRSTWLPLRPVCEAMGIQLDAQRKRIQRSKVMGDQWVLIKTQVPYGDSGAMREQEVFCLNLEQLPFWLGTIDSDRIKDDDVRSQVILFQKQFSKAAWASFRSEIIPEDMRAEMDTYLPPDEQRYHQLMDEAANHHIRTRRAIPLL